MYLLNSIPISWSPTRILFANLPTHNHHHVHLQTDSRLALLNRSPEQSPPLLRRRRLILIRTRRRDDVVLHVLIQRDEDQIRVRFCNIVGNGQTVVAQRLQTATRESLVQCTDPSDACLVCGAGWIMGGGLEELTCT